MSDLYSCYIHSFNLSNQTDSEFFSYINDLYYTDEIQGMAVYPQHGSINRLQHITSVCYISYIIAKKKNADIRATLTGAVLHDLFYYDWHVAGDGSHRLHGYRHPGFAAKNAEILFPDITEKEKKIILRHMWPLTPTPPESKEGLIVSLADKYCATQEVLLSRLASYRQKISADIARESGAVRI